MSCFSAPWQLRVWLLWLLKSESDLSLCPKVSEVNSRSSNQHGRIRGLFGSAQVWWNRLIISRPWAWRIFLLLTWSHFSALMTTISTTRNIRAGQRWSALICHPHRRRCPVKPEFLLSSDHQVGDVRVRFSFAGLSGETAHLGPPQTVSVSEDQLQWLYSLNR